jgi:hypothetical protein
VRWGAAAGGALTSVKGTAVTVITPDGKAAYLITEARQVVRPPIGVDTARVGQAMRGRGGYRAGVPTPQACQQLAERPGPPFS